MEKWAARNGKTGERAINSNFNAAGSTIRKIKLIKMKFFVPVISSGTTRTKSGFLFFPKKIGTEIRWLEKAAWIEEYWQCDWYAIQWLQKTTWN